jgi:TetR/AcrR family transcriptional regulator, transcriptional repressor for nem operon
VKKSKAETEETRRRIVAAAADEVRRKGLAGANMGEVMSAVGLTHGGFYRHFPSREQLFAEGLAQAMAASESIMAERVVKGGTARAIESYLSALHRDEPVPRCPYAALGSELTRDSELKSRAWRGVSAQIEVLAQSIGGSDEARDRATVLFALMMGALTLSRLAGDKATADRILALARREGFAIVDRDQIGDEQPQANRRGLRRPDGRSGIGLKRRTHRDRSQT